MIKVRNLSKTYTAEHQPVPALRGIDFELKPGEFYTLLGPSGCGKSTTLRCIAGFEEPEDGEIWLGEQLVFSRSRHVNVPPHKRDFGIVFQSYAIWPHMSVFENAAFPLQHGRKKVPKQQVKERVMRALRLVHIEELAGRFAPLLSGGQQQRVALARALVHEPPVLLLDEPLSNLDAKLREEMRVELRDLIKRLGITALYVTHDQLEALTMSDRLAVMNNGNIVQEGTPLEVHKTPRERFVARFIGQANLLPGRVSRVNVDGTGVVSGAYGSLRCRMPEATAVGDEVEVMFRPDDVVLKNRDDGPLPEGNVLECSVSRVVFVGEALECLATLAEQEVRIKVHSTQPLKTGETVLLHLPSERCWSIPASSPFDRSKPEAEALAPELLSRAQALE